MAHLVRWLAGLTAAAGVIGCGLALTQRGRVPSSTAPAALSMPTSPIAGFFGINEAISVPSALVFSARISGEQQRAELAADAADTRSLHARTVRANSHTYPFFNHQRFSKAPQRALTRADRYFEVVGEAGLEPVMVIGPWPGIQTANYTDHYLPDDIDSYASFVERIVERYDGDGVDDMPGLLQPVRAWEVDNEPDLHNRVPPRGAKRTVDPSSFETPAEYATVLLATAAAIRRADPQATILTAGIYNIRSASGRAYLEAVLATPGVLDTVDAISLHCYSDEDSLEAVERTIDIGAQVAPGLPIWLTEIAVASDDRKPWVDEDWQAKMVVGIHAVALARGVERVLWHTLADPPARAGKAHEQPFSSHSLLRSLHSSWERELPEGTALREPKPAGIAYARLAEHLDGVSRSEIAELPASGGRLLQVGEDLLAFWGEPVLPEGAWRTEDLRTGAEAPAGARATAPAWIVRE